MNDDDKQTLAQTLAEACADAMWKNDKASANLGMEVIEVRPSYAKLQMKVRADMLNGHDICHGGFIFTLADSAFAFACNTHNQNTVAQHCMVSYLQPCYQDDVLTATATEHYLQGRSGMTDVTVTNQNGKKVAEFRGFSRSIKGTLIDV